MVKDTIYVDTTKQVVIYLPTSIDDSVSETVVDTVDTPSLQEEIVVLETPEVIEPDTTETLKIKEELDSAQEQKMNLAQEIISTNTLKNLGQEIQEELIDDLPRKEVIEELVEEIKEVPKEVEEVPKEVEKVGDVTEIPSTVESQAADNSDSMQDLENVPDVMEEETLKEDEKVEVMNETPSALEKNVIDDSDSILDLENVPDVVVEESDTPERDYESIHKRNRILVWRLVKRFMFYADQKYDLSTGMNKSMENYRDLFQNNAVIYHDLMKSPEHVDYRDYFDDVSEYFDNVKIDQEFEDVWMIYNRLFQADLSKLETESNFSDEDGSSFYYELPIKKYVSNKIGNDGKIIQLDKPEEYNLRFKILVDYQELEARIAGIYLN